MGFNHYIAKQFANPHGFVGKIVTAIMNNQNHSLYKATEELLSLSASETVLDIGCGNGYVLNLLANRYSCQFTGIDISESMIETASQRNVKFLKDGKMNFLCKNAVDMPFADNSFDKAFTINTVYFWDSLENVLAEIHRILKPKGLFINTLYTNKTLDRISHTKFEYRRFTEEELTNAGRLAGFDIRILPIDQGEAYSLVYQKI